MTMTMPMAMAMAMPMALPMAMPMAMPIATCLSKGTGSAVYVEAVRLFSFSWILVIFWMAHYNEKTCWYMSLRGAASCCL